MLVPRKELLEAARVALFCIAVCLSATAQFGGNSAPVSGTVMDSTSAVVPNATVTIQNPVSRYTRTAHTDGTGRFSFPNVPFNSYHLSVSAKDFASYVQDVDVHSSLPVNLPIQLQVAGSSTSVTVEATAEDLIENDPIAHTDVDKELFDKLPLESQSSSLSSLVTLATPGVSADSNGLFHAMGDHAENSFSLDGQPITDQQSKIFSNQVPLDSVQSVEVIEGAPPAEYGGKTSLIINVTTRSGQGMTTPHGEVTSSYGSFGTATAGLNFGYGGSNWGNFFSGSGLRSGRFLDPPEFVVFHDKGNEENVFDRVDLKPSAGDSIMVNLGYTRSWFQNPNSYDQQYHNVNGVQLTNPDGTPLGLADQVSQIKTFNIAPSWTHLLSSRADLSVGGYVRRDQYNYYPSTDLFNDYAPDLQSETVAQNRRLTNAGLRSAISYVAGIHNVKAGMIYQQTFLTEDDNIGIVDPTVVSGMNCLNAVTNQPLPGTPCAVLAPYDLTGGGGHYTPGGVFRFHGHTDVKETALYLQDAITIKNWSINAGLRGDFYNGLSRDKQAEPRLGVSYNIKRTNTVLRVSYARTLESPFNENLVIASTGCSIPFLATLVPPPGVPCNSGPIRPGYRNEFHAGLQQALGKYLVVSGDYIWKYTHNGYDFGNVGATPIYFPIEWHNSKIPGYAIRVSMPNYHGFSVLVTMSSVAARFFLPQVAGLPIVPPATGVFRIDHDEKFNQTTHFQYQPWKQGPWFGFNWRYDSGQVAGSSPCLGTTGTCSPSTSVADGGSNPNIPSGYIALVSAITGAALTADQEFQAGFFCGTQRPTPTTQIGTKFGGVYACPASQFGSNLIRVPGSYRENDDHNPQRIASRNLFDMSVGDDNLFHGDKHKVSLQVTAINLTNKYSLYNFLSTFSGTHYVTPRTVTGEIGFHF